MGTTDSYSPLSPPSFAGKVKAVGCASASSSSISEHLHRNTKQVDEMAFSQGLFTSNASHITIDDDSFQETLTGTSSVNNDSDCESIQTNLCSSGDSQCTAALTDDFAPNSADKLLLEELQELSSVDRTKIQEEIHGVFTCAIAEDEEKIGQGLMKLEEEIRSIRREVLLSSSGLSSSGYTYEESIWTFLGLDEGSSTQSLNNEKMIYSYIFHESFRLRFLRADLYDARKAAHRYLRCLECLLKYYGRYALQRPLMYNDLGKECQDAIKSGFVQILPSRDRAGRLVVFCQPASEERSMSTMIKLFTYVFQVVSEDAETQKRGVVFVLSENEGTLELLSDSDAKKEYGLYREACMVRRACTHFCMPENNPKMVFLRSMMMLAMSREDRLRTRIHMDGLTTETMHKLMTFGVPVSEFPITSTGAIKTKNHVLWTKTRKAIDDSRMRSLEECFMNKLRTNHGFDQQQLSKSLAKHCVDFCPFPPTYDEVLQYHGKEPIMYPMLNDVLFSKGGKNVTHYGNIEFTDLMKRALLTYVDGSCLSGTPFENRKKRKEIRQNIIDDTRARGGRFLTLDKKLPGGYCWVEIEKGPNLHDRIATSLYDHKRRLAAKLKTKSERSDEAMTGIGNSKRRKLVAEVEQPVFGGCIF